MGVEREAEMSGLCLLFDDQPRAPDRGSGARVHAMKLTLETGGRPANEVCEYPRTP